MIRYLAAIIGFLFISLSGNAQDYEMENNEIKLFQPVSFETGTDKLLPESDAALNIIKKYLEEKRSITLLRVECHSDNSGNGQAAQTLTEKRALAICNALVAKGVDCKRLLPVGFGGMKPIADNTTPEGRTANRRICFVNAALAGHMIGGLPADGGGKVAGDICSL